jgi:hypothetical protein
VEPRFLCSWAAALCCFRRSSLCEHWRRSTIPTTTATINSADTTPIRTLIIGVKRNPECGRSETSQLWLITNHIVQSLPLGTGKYWTRQEIPYFKLSLKEYLSKTLALEPALTLYDPVHTVSYCIFKFLLPIIRFLTGLLLWHFVWSKFTYILLPVLNVWLKLR